MLTASVSVLCVEAVLGAIALFVQEQTYENAGLPHHPMAVLLLIVAAPFLAVAGAVLGALLSVGLVMPVLVVAAWLGRRLSGEAWRWVPATAAAVTTPPALAAAVLAETGLLPGLGLWLVTTAALTATALVARRLLLPDRPRLSGGVMFGRVVLYGTLAVVTAVTLAGIGLFAGIGYEPPRLSAERVTGTWSDGRGGTLVLTPDGTATATGVETFADDFIDPVMRECTSTGTWEYDPGNGPWAQEVAVSADNCPTVTWEIFGTPEHPKLFVHIGDPDSWDLYILQRRDHAWLADSTIRSRTTA
ncbi:hypothetical protein ACIO1C_03920 [Streptomyces sp. NPDC087420]|uniref:hypothetical protein n=1 Tax=Streptomyces sp. NPDC087420 TaxID=3365785 RepID=UPI003836DC2B